MLEIIWVFGASAAGKETFIREISKNKDLQQSFEWGDKTVAVIENSIKYLTKLTKERNLIIDNALEYVNCKNTIILIKAQTSDIRSDRIFKLRTAMPNAEHKVFFLTAKFDLLCERCRTKSWWVESMTDAVLKKWILNQLYLLKGLDGFEITAVDSTDSVYKKIDYLPDKWIKEFTQDLKDEGIVYEFKEYSIDS